MAKRENQKLKMLWLIRILAEETDADHGLTMSQIMDRLEAQDISCERKSIYSDIECLKDFGYDIDVLHEGREYRYALVSRHFETAELKLLVDSVQSAKFITERKSRELIRKLEKFVSRYDAGRLSRQVYVGGRIKSMNESIFYNVDSIHEAVADNRKITFHYYSWTLDKKLAPRRNGALYTVSPLGLCWDDENYYLVAFDEKDRKIKHYRVDKMAHITKTEEARDESLSRTHFDMAEYSRKVFGMFGGEEQLVGLECANDLVGVIIDRFGKDVSLIREGEDHFRVNVRVALSPQFLSWVIGLGGGVKVVSPEAAVQQMREVAQRLTAQYTSGRISEEN